MPQIPELEWRSYRDEGHASVKKVSNWLGSLNDYQREAALGDIVALRERAAAGLIVEGDDEDEGGFYESLKPIRLDPDLYELRWNLFGRHLRQYHAEPKGLTKILVDLHLHIKFIDYKSKRRTQRAQDAEISLALLRYRAGERKEWL